MKTLEQLKELTSKCLDGRDFNRLAKFVPYSMIKDFGMEPNEEYDNEEKWNSTVVEFTRENVLKQLEEDVRFGFEKALNQRGISASLMFECVMMWNYILEEGLEGWSEDDYAFYGLPLFKATAVKYGWDNPIGEDSGTLHVMMHGDTNYNPTPEFTQYGGSNIENSITIIDGIPNDGGDW